MFNIRQNVFETNSSSQHTIAVMKKENDYFTNDEVISEFDNHKVVFNDCELSFGRYPFEILTSFKQKMGYLIGEYCGYDESNRDGTIDQLTEICKEIDPQFINIELPKYKDGTTIYGGIDHQSSAVLSSFISNKGLTFKEFLLNKRYIIIVDGDEYCTWGNILDTNLIDRDAFEEV